MGWCKPCIFGIWDFLLNYHYQPIIILNIQNKGLSNAIDLQNYELKSTRKNDVTQFDMGKISGKQDNFKSGRKM